MTISGRFVGDAPYVAAHVRHKLFHGLVWFLVDTGASRTTILDRDSRSLRIPDAALHPSPLPIVGVGGSVRSFSVSGVEIALPADGGGREIKQDLWLVRHDLSSMPVEECARILRLPSVLGRDIINRFRLVMDYRSGKVELVE